MAEPGFYRFLPACGPAGFAVSGFWELCDDAAPGDAELIAPDGCCEAVFHLGNPPDEARGLTFERQPGALLYGPLTRALTLRPSGRIHVRAVRFNPWGVSLLTPALPGMRDTAVHIRDALGDLGARLEDAARTATSLGQFAQTAQTLIAQSLRIDADAASFARMLAGIAESPPVFVTELAERAGRSGRTLERIFLARTGLRPGEHLRIARFQRAREAVSDTRLPLAVIALEAGYADQAHMNRDFLRFAGRTPGALRRNTALFDPLYQDAGAPGSEA